MAGLLRAKRARWVGRFDRRRPLARGAGLALLLIGLQLAAAAPLHATTYAELERLPEAEILRLKMAARGVELAQLLIVEANWLDERDPAAALTVLAEAEALLEPVDGEHLAYLFTARCWSEHIQSNHVDAQRSCLAAVSAARAVDDQRALSRALGRQSILYFSDGALEAAMQIAQESLQAAQAAGDSSQLARALNNLGINARAQGLFDQSLAYFTRGMEAVDHAADPSHYRVLAFNVGLTHADLGQFELAKDYYQKTLVWAREAGSLHKELTALIYIAKADIGLGNFSQAIASLESAVARPELQFDAGHLAYAFSALGDAYLEMGSATEALAHYRQGLAHAAPSANYFELRELRLGQGKALLALEELSSAYAVLRLLIDDLREEGAGEILIDALLAFSEVSLAQNDPAAALVAYREAHELEASLHRTVVDQRLARARAQYEVDEKELALARAERDGLIRSGILALVVALLVIGYLFFSRRVQSELVATERRESAKLEKLVEERTSALQDQMIRRAQADEQRVQLERRLAEDDKLRVLGQLTGGVAHDFNNLLTVVMGSAELLQARADARGEPGSVGSDDDRALLDHIVTAARSGAGITRALMSYARQQPLQLERTDLVRHLTDMVPLLERTLGGSLQVDLQISSGGQLAVLLDRDQLTSALLNLALNARDAQSNTGVIHIQLGRRDAHTAELTMQDNGRGMTAEQIQRACEPFYSTKDDGQGNGLGLSMVYGFTKQLGGDLEISSVVGEGTRVSLLLPLVTQHADLQVA